MLYEVMFVDANDMSLIYGYSLKGEFNSEDMAARTGLASLINLAVKQLLNPELLGNDIITLKTSKDHICFKVWGDFIVMVRGTSEKENIELINKICKGTIPKEIDEIDLKLKTVLKSIDDTTIDRFSKIWG
ncbi:MAG: hypothetical protein ACTSSJ_06560 [Candidatus Odinarchaeia archaeon]